MLGINALPAIEAQLCIEAEILARQLEVELGVK
jgi:hypothetical protein